MADVALSPRVRSTLNIKRVRGKLAAGDLVELWQFLSLDIKSDFFGVPVGLHVAETGLAIDAKAPHVEVALVSQGSGMSKAGRAARHFHLLASLLIGWEGYVLG